MTAVGGCGAWRRLDGFGPEAISVRCEAGPARSEAEGRRRMPALHGGRTDGPAVAPNLWGGIGLVRDRARRGGVGTALVGRQVEVAERIVEYLRLGVEEFVLSGHPHVEEAYWGGEGCCGRPGGGGICPRVRGVSRLPSRFRSSPGWVVDPRVRGGSGQSGPSGCAAGPRMIR